jgi:hypothetical protein
MQFLECLDGHVGSKKSLLAMTAGAFYLLAEVECSIKCKFIPPEK